MKKLITMILLLLICAAPIQTVQAKTDFSNQKQHNTQELKDKNREKTRTPIKSDNKNSYPDGMKIKTHQEPEKMEHKVIDNTFNLEDAYNNLACDFFESDNSIAVRIQNYYIYSINITVYIFYMDEDYNIIYEDKISIGRLNANGKKNVEFKPFDKNGKKIKYYDYGVDFDIEQA